MTTKALDQATTSAGNAGGAAASKWWFISLACLPAFGVWLVDLLSGQSLNLFESGTLMSGGMRVMQGETLYRDVFAFYGPLEYLLPGVAGLIGPGNVGIVLFGLVLPMVASVVAYRIVTRLRSRPLAAAIVPLLLSITGASSARSLPALAAILCLMQVEAGAGRRWLIAGGALSGIGLLWIQDGGVWITIAVVLVAIFGSRSSVVRSLLSMRALAVASAGAMIPLLPTAGYFAVRGALGSWIYSCFVFPNTIYTHRSATEYVRGLASSWSDLPFLQIAYKTAFYLLPYLAVFASAAVLVLIAAARLRRPPPRAVLPVSFAVLACYALLQLRVLAASLDEAKLADVCAPTVVALFGLALARDSGISVIAPTKLTAFTRSWRSALALACMGWFVVWPVQKYAHHVAHLAFAPASSGSGRLAGFPITGGVPPQTSLPELEQVVAEITLRTSVADKIFVAPTQPYVYYLSRRGNVARYDYLDPVYVTPEVDREIASAIVRGKPKVVVLTDSHFAGRNLSGRQMATRTYAVIDANYGPVKTIGHWTILVPRDVPQNE